MDTHTLFVEEKQVAVLYFPPKAEYYTLVESKLHTQTTTRRHETGMIHTPWGAAVMVHYSRA